MTLWQQRRRQHCLAVEQIMREVCIKHQIAQTEFLSCHRNARLVRARREACWRARVETKASFLTIAEVFERDHSTVIHHLRKHLWEMRRESEVPPVFPAIHKLSDDQGAYLTD